MESITQRLKCHKAYTSAPDLAKCFFHHNYSCRQERGLSFLREGGWRTGCLFLWTSKPASYLYKILTAANTNEHLPCMNALQLVILSMTLWVGTFYFTPTLQMKKLRHRAIMHHVLRCLGRRELGFEFSSFEGWVCSLVQSAFLACMMYLHSGSGRVFHYQERKREKKKWIQLTSSRRWSL